MCLLILSADGGKGGEQWLDSLLPMKEPARTHPYHGKFQAGGKEMLSLPFATFGLFPRTSVRSHIECLKGERRPGRQDQRRLNRKLSFSSSWFPAVLQPSF
ncbi:unnamed protein product [Rangifer tarandus platyrhynchus]|uniref:Uncharacterized protein n=2 Tax=Rangifer tarandus platyrhynchus TaxID=3082113 RepID=A0ABN8XYL9_RANTA|nr:unnamed protein product [Rangifer tarandus platyrhynchus]